MNHQVPFLLLLM